MKNEKRVITTIRSEREKGDEQMKPVWPFLVKQDLPKYSAKPRVDDHPYSVSATVSGYMVCHDTFPEKVWMIFSNMTMLKMKSYTETWSNS